MKKLVLNVRYILVVIVSYVVFGSILTINAEANMVIPWKKGEEVAKWRVPDRINNELVYFSFYRRFLGLDTQGYYIVQDFYKEGDIIYTDPYLVVNQEAVTTIKLDIFDYLDGVSGAYIQWHRNGTRAKETQYEAGKPHGPALAWHDNNQKSVEGYYKNGNPEGLWKGWHRNGQRHWELSFEKGVVQGAWLWWYESGQKRGESFYKNDKECGLWIEWHENGKKSEEGQYLEGKRVGIWRRWDEKGNLVEEIDYDNVEQRWTHLSEQ